MLLTLDNLSSRKQYVRARNTFNALFDMGCVPIVNENDTVAVEVRRCCLKPVETCVESAGFQ